MGERNKTAQKQTRIFVVKPATAFEKSGFISAGCGGKKHRARKKPRISKTVAGFTARAQVACAIAAVGKRNLVSLAQKRKKFWPPKCRVFGVLFEGLSFQKNPEDAAFSGPKLFPQNFPKLPRPKIRRPLQGPKIPQIKRKTCPFVLFWGLAGRPPTRGARGGASPVPKSTKLRI